MDLGLKGCKAFIAGASRGLGKACAKALAGEGARVFVCSRNVEELKRAAAEIGAAGFSAADVSRPEEVKRVVAEAIAALGGLDCLVTNAGGPPTAPFEKAGDGDWDIAFELNLMSAVRLIREALPALKASRRGRIVNLTGYGVKEPLTDRAKSLGITPDEQFKRFSETIPVRRMGQPNEIGDLCAYLCSPQAGYLTGQTIVVDGGVNRSI